MTTLALVNEQTLVCENITLDDRPASEIVISGYIVLDLDVVGGGGIGDVWDGEKLIGPTPVNNQPVTSGVQEI